MPRKLKCECNLPGCNTCRARNYYRTHPEKMKEYAANYRLRHQKSTAGPRTAKFYAPRPEVAVYKPADLQWLHGDRFIKAFDRLVAGA